MMCGIVTTGITFLGLNMDIGHLRSIRWVQDDDPQSPINGKPELTGNGKSAAQNRWIAYNKMRGQYSSAMEHAVPEQFWVDKSQCRYQDEGGKSGTRHKRTTRRPSQRSKPLPLPRQKASASTPSTKTTGIRRCPSCPSVVMWEWKSAMPFRRARR